MRKLADSLPEGFKDHPDNFLVKNTFIDVSAPLIRRSKTTSPRASREGLEIITLDDEDEDEDHFSCQSAFPSHRWVSQSTPVIGPETVKVQRPLDDLLKESGQLFEDNVHGNYRASGEPFQGGFLSDSGHLSVGHRVDGGLRTDCGFRVGSGPHVDSGARMDSALRMDQPQTIREQDDGSVSWIVDARKLNGNDKQAVSPPFRICFSEAFPNVLFKMMISPKAVNDNKGGASFKKANRKGFIQIKCEMELSETVGVVTYLLRIRNHTKAEEWRGPMEHNFSHNAVSFLPKEKEEWDFNSVLEKDSMVFFVDLKMNIESTIAGLHRGAGHHGGCVRV